jgi:hypothetical protein
MFHTLTLIARNILLLTLSLNDAGGIHDTALWNIYYHPYLDNESMKLLSDQATKLHDLATSVQSWTDGQYGQQFRFYDRGTLTKVRDIWYTYRVTYFKGNEWERHIRRLKAAMQRAMNPREAGFEGMKFVLTGMRSAAPAGICAVEDAPKLSKHY